MTGILISGWLMGALGSLHCVGMCGPLALSLPLGNAGPFQKFTGSLLYNLGRVVTYSMIGLFTGLIGQGAGFLGFQQTFSISMGLLILLLALMPRLNHWKPVFMGPWYEALRGKIGQLFARGGYRSVFVIGLLNGLLPCGLIYMAMAASAAMGTMMNSSLFMAAFGLGTLPLMWAVSYSAGLLQGGVRRKIKAWYPYLMMLMAGLLIVRGLGLGIPYLSPSASDNKENIECHQ